MAVRDELIFDLSQALAQIDDLERQLDSLLQPIKIPVTLDDSGVAAGNLSKAEQVTQELRQELGLTDDALEEVRREADRTGKELEDSAKKGTKGFRGLGTALTGVATGIAAFVGLREVTRFFTESITAASDLAESTSKAQVVFGSFFDDIQAFASTAPQALGLANQQALEFTGTFGNLFTALGLSQQAAADLSPAIVTLGADLASFNNIEVTDALDKLRAGLVGEAEPLRTLGVNLNAAATAAKAVELGLANSTSSVSDAAKVQARYALILEQTGSAQGDFARTAEGTANQIRTFSAGIETLKAQVGEALIPALQSALDILEDFLPALSAVAIEFGDITGAISDSEADLRRWAGFSGQALDSAELLAGALNLAGRNFGEIARNSKNDEQALQTFSDQVEGFVGAFEGGPQEIQRVIDSLDNLVTQFDLTSEQAEIVAGILQSRLSVAAAESADSIFLLRGATREGFGAFPDDIGDIASALDDVSAGVQRVQFERIIEGFDRSGQFAETAKTKIQGYADSLLGLSDPAFAALDAQDRLVQAQEDYNDAITDPDATSDDRAKATANLAEAQQRLLATSQDLPGNLDGVSENIGILATQAGAAQDDVQALQDKLAELNGTTTVAEIELFLKTVASASDRNAFEQNIAVPTLPDTATSQGPSTVVIQNFDNTPSPTTETTRAAQSVAAIVRS